LGEEEKIKVTIISRDTVTVYPKLRQPMEIVMTTYVAPEMPPRTIEIPKEEWSKEEEAKRIRKDIEEYKAKAPEEIEV